jgi:hypothetical protein
MTAPAIKAALAAARIGICHTLDINPGEPACETPCLLCREGSAAAVAAFLRALPMPDNNSGGWACHLVADAVELAAREGSDER